MSGFPNRPAGPAFGPTRENEEPVQNPKRELDAADMNLNFWQVAGMGLVSPRVTLIATGSDVADPLPTPHPYQGIAWDPKQLLPDLVVTHPGPGVYQIVFQATYPDQDGVAVATSLKGGICTPQGTAILNATVDLANPLTVDITIFANDGTTPTDADFLLQLW